MDSNMIRERYSNVKCEKRWRNKIFDLLSPKQRKIFVLDDQIGVSSSSTSVADLFSKRSLHKNLTVIYLVQHVYNQSKSQITISLNLHYSEVFCNGQDASQFRTMANRICPTDGKWLVD